MIYAPSGVDSSVGDVLRCSGVVMLSEERYELAISMLCVSAWRRYPCDVVWLCADIEGEGTDRGDCTNIAVRHHGAQCASPLRSKRRRGGRMRYLVVVDGISG